MTMSSGGRRAQSWSMRSKPTRRLLVLPLLFVACAHSTPVGPAPLPPEETPKLQAALVGTCTVTETQKEGGDRKKAEGLSWTFQADGHAQYDAANPFGGNVTAKFTYKLDGRNVLMDGPFKAIRVDEWSGNTMKWFVYDLSETYWCTKK
jgi:hypothetical protein